MKAGLCLAFALAVALPARSQEPDDLDSVLGGFAREEAEPAAASGESNERSWDLSGSIEQSGSFNYRSHRSDTGTDYQGLQRLRNRANLQLDWNLPRDWKLRAEG